MPPQQRTTDNHNNNGTAASEPHKPTGRDAKRQSRPDNDSESDGKIVLDDSDLVGEFEILEAPDDAPAPPAMPPVLSGEGLRSGDLERWLRLLRLVRQRLSKKQFAKSKSRSKLGT